MILIILEFTRHKLLIAYGLTLMPLGLRGWDAFATPGALTHTRISWALSPTVPQVLGVTVGFPLCPWCFEHSSWRGAQHFWLILHWKKIGKMLKSATPYVLIREEFDDFASIIKSLKPPWGHVSNIGQYVREEEIWCFEVKWLPCAYVANHVISHTWSFTTTSKNGGDEDFQFVSNTI